MMIFDWVLIAFAFVLALLGTLAILLGIALAVTLVKRWWTGELRASMEDLDDLLAETQYTQWTDGELEALLEATREDKRDQDM